MNKATIEYDFQENPSKAVDQNGSKFHVRIQNNQTITLKEIRDRLQRRSTVTDVDITAVLTGIEAILTEELAQGNAVTLDGICRFEPILGTNGQCNGTEKGNAIQLKAVRVRASKLLTDNVASKLHPCTRVHAKRSPKIEHEELITWLGDYFKKNTSIRRTVLEKEFGLTRTYASRKLRQLVEEKILLHPGPKNDYSYYPEPHFFKK